MVNKISLPLINNVEDVLTPEIVDRIVACGIEIDWISGWAPVQSEGRLGKLAYYFRARGESWAVYIGKPECDLMANNVFENRGGWPYAGYMPLLIALGFILDSVEEYLDKYDGKS